VIPQRVDELTPEALSGALGLGASVTAVRAEDIGTGVGVFGIIARLHLSWDGDNPTLPRTVIAKMPTSAEANRAVGLALGLYEREHRFYRDAAAHVSVRVPHCFVNMTDGDGNYLLVLEDLCAYEAGDQLAGLSPERALAIVDRLAAHHARWWDRPELHALTWLLVQNDPAYLHGVPPIVSAGVAALPSFVGPLPDGSLELARRVDAAFVDITHACAGGPHTFVHGDVRLDNLFFDSIGDPLVIDWQLSMRSRGVCDVVWLLATSMDVDVQNTSAAAMFARYGRSLHQHGIEVTTAELQRAAAEHAAYLLSGPLSLIGTFDFAEAGDGRAAELTRRWVARGFNLALLLGSGDVIS
jgi:hypothetical protein